MLTRAQFLEAYSAFATAGNELIDATLVKAERRIGEAWGDLEDEAHGLLTAHMLAIDPKGQMARLVNQKDGSTTYGKEFAELQTMAACGLRVFPPGVIDAS